MDRLVIEGGRPLVGEVEISGAKNAALPAMTACLLSDEPLQLERVPMVRDVATMRRLLAHMGADSELVGDSGLRLDASRLSRPEAPYELVKTMRASVLALGPLLARHGRARVSLPGGCAIGARPINHHLLALEGLGADLKVEHGYVVAEASRLRGARVRFPQVTVTGTENLLMAASLAVGETLIENAASEPEVVDLARLLGAMGAHIEGAGTPVIRVQGVERLHAASHRVIADRIEAGTFLVAAAISGGDLTLKGAEAEHLASVLDRLAEAGVMLESSPGRIRAWSKGGLRAADVRTEPYPGFPTDMQAQFIALMTQAEGISVVTETIFENRFMHVAELRRLGAQIRIDDASAIIKGPVQLEGATVMATDLRASASLLLAALVATGSTSVERVYHIDRGYERIEQKLSAVGASIQRLSDRA